MILVDTSVWIDHFRAADAKLTQLLLTGEVLAHPFVIGEISLGHLSRRDIKLIELKKLPHAEVAMDSEVHIFIERQKLSGQGIGYVDAHLLCSAVLTPASSIWTRDKRLAAVAAKLRLSAPF